MKLRANDQLHISSVKAGNIAPGEEFTVSEPVGKDLIKRGLAMQVRVAKAAAKPANKKAQEPANKSA